VIFHITGMCFVGGDVGKYMEDVKVFLYLPHRLVTIVTAATTARVAAAAATSSVVIVACQQDGTQV